MSDRQARRADIARDVHELHGLVMRLDEHQRSDPADVYGERVDILEAAAMLINTIARMYR